MKNKIILFLLVFVIVEGFYLHVTATPLEDLEQEVQQGEALIEAKPEYIQSEGAQRTIRQREYLNQQTKPTCSQ